MSKGFNLTAELNLRGPSNIRAVVSDIRRQIGTVSATVSPVLDKSSLKSISSQIKQQLGTITGNVNVRLNPSSAKNIANDIKKQINSVSTNISIGVNTASIKSAGKTIRQQLSGLVVPIGVSASNASINQIRSRIRNQLGNLNVTVNIRLNSGVNQTLTTYNNNLTRLNNLLVQTSTNATAAANSINALAAAMRSASGIRLQPINTNLGNIGNSASRTGQAIGGATNEIENFGRQAGLAIRRFAAFSTVAGVIYSITSALKSGVSAFITYDQQLTRISQVTGDSKDKLGAITSTITQLSTALGVSSSELASTTLTLAQAGLTAKDTEKALKALALSALAPSFDDMNQTVEGSIALMRQFNIGSSQLENALGSINAVSAKFAVEASDIITAIQRTGGVFAASSRGVSEGTDALNEFIAVFTSIRATTRESAETIATGLRTIFTRIQRSETIEALKEFGVTLTDLEGKFVGPYIAVQRLSEGLGRLDPRDLKFSSIVEELGGFRQIGKVLPLIQQFSTAQEALKVAQSGQGSLAKDAATGQQALAIQIQKVREQFLGLIRSVGNTNSFQKMVQVGLDLASALIKVADAAKELIPIISLFAAARGAAAITQFVGGFGQGLRGAPSRRAHEGGPIRAFAAGGYVPGVGDSDTVPARLTPGEFVIRKKAVQAIGVNKLHALNRNSGGPIQKFGLGGRVYSVDPMDRDTQASHVSDRIELSDIDRKKYANLPVGRGKRSSKFNSQAVVAGSDFHAKTPYLISLPTIANQAAKRGGVKIGDSLYEGVDAESLKAWIKINPGLLLGGRRAILPKNLVSDPTTFANQFAGSITTSVVHDSDLAMAFSRVKHLLSPKYIEQREQQLDLFISTGKRQVRHEGFRKAALDANAQKKNFGGAIRRFANAGPVTRSVGVVDSDDWKDDPVVAAQMQAMGISRLDDYKVHMSNLVAEKRKSGDIRKLRTVYGAAASGKTTKAYGGARSEEADNARLRKTTRRPIRVPSDLEGLNEIIDTTSVLGPRNAVSLRASDRIHNLSSRSESSQKAVLARREGRDRLAESGVPDPSGRNYGLFKRKTGATKGAPLDTGVDEAWLAAAEVSGVDTKKVITTDVASGRRIGAPTVRTPEKTALYMGNFGPSTSGHLGAAMAGAKKAKVSPKDTVIMVTGDTPIDPFKRDDQKERTAILPQTSSSGLSRLGMAQAVFGPKGFNVAAAPKNSAPGSIPKAFKVGDDSYIVPRDSGNVAIMGDDKGSIATDRYSKSGYSPLAIARNGVSGTAARAAIMSNDIEAMKKLLTPEGIAYLQPQMVTLQRRPQLLDSILERFQRNSQLGRGRAGRYSATLSQLSKLPSRITKNTPEADASEILRLRDLRDNDEKTLGRRPARMLRRLERLGKSSGGYIQKFSEGGIAEELKTMGGADLIKLAKQRGINIPIGLNLDRRAKLSPENEAQKRRLLESLTQAGIIAQAKAAKTSATAQSRSVAVVGLTGERGSQEVVTPGATDKTTGASVRGVPVTLQTGTLPPALARRVQALIRNRVERIVADVGMQISQTAGMGKNKRSRADIRRITSKDLEDITGSIFEKGLGAANLQYDEKSQAIDLPQGLNPKLAALVGVDSGVMTDVTNTSSKETAKRKLKEGQFDRGRLEARARYGKSQFATGGHVEDTVPALLTPGEFVINKKAASRIGMGRLNSLNHADKSPVKGFNKGGPVGHIQEFAIGGAVQKFFFGGRAGPAARPDTINTETIGASGTTVQALRQLSQVLEQLGVSSSRSSALLTRGYQATAAEAERAYRADLVMARAVGASAEVIHDLEHALRESERAASAEVSIRQQLGDIGGGALQNALAYVEETVQHLTEQARNAARAAAAPGTTDAEIEETVRAGAGDRRNAAYQAAAGGLGVDLTAANAQGTDLERTIQALMRDVDTLDQMNQQYIRQRRSAIANEAQAAGDHARAARIRSGAERQIENILRQEVTARTNAIRDTALVEGSRDTGTQPSDSTKSLMVAGGLITIGNLISQSLNTKSSASMAGLSAGIGATTSTAGIGIAVVGQINDFTQKLEQSGNRVGAGLSRLASNIAGGATIVLSLVSGFKEFYNAIEEFNIEVINKKFEFATKGIENEFKTLRESIKAVDFTRLNNELTASSVLFAKSLDLVSSKTTMTFTNMLEFLDMTIRRPLRTSEQNDQTQKDFSKRTDILRLGGSDAYYRSLSDENANAEYAQIIPQLAQEQAAMGKQLSDSLLESFKERAMRGQSFKDIVSDPNFDNFSKALANADAAIRQRILEIENSGMDPAAADNLKKDIISNAAQEKVRQQIAIVTREKDIKSLQRYTAVFMGSLNRMFKNMEQAVSATSNALADMQNSIDATISSLTGQAGLKNVNLQTNNILANPRAYNDDTVSTARSTGAGFFGQSSELVKSLLGFGSTAENTVMKTINDVIKKNPDANDEVIASQVNINIREALKNLGLPPEIGDRLANQVGKAIGELRKSNDNEISFGDLQEKVAGLSSILETAQGVEAITIKALANFGETLNSYSNNINKIIDIEISSRDKLRKANDILINSSVELSKTLGRTINLEDSRQRLLNKVKSMTGGLDNSADISQQILSLNNQKTQQESSRSQVAERGPAGADDFVRLSNDVKQTSIALRENYSSLKLLAESTEFASDAMQKIQDAQQRNSSKVSFIEKLVTSTPEEISNLNSTFNRLQNNMNGQVNTINNSITAQKAYVEAIQNGASNLEAMKAAQVAFTNERKDTLGLLQDIMPFLGEGRKASNIKANVLESMLNESGVGVSPMLMDVLNNLRNPEGDPAVAAAMTYYNEAISLQATANTHLAKIDEHLAKDTAEANAKAISDALSKITLTFFNAELRDIAAGINNLVPIKPQAKALGGVIYASAGQMVNFQAKGSDTVPAMLTPGEFVVNRAATARNRPLLESINSNNYSSGGSVRYYATGGFVHDLGNPEIFSKASTTSETEVIDLNLTAISALNKAQGNLYKSPNIYTILKNRKQTPKDGSDQLDMTELNPEGGAIVVPGVGPSMARVEPNFVNYQVIPGLEDLLNRDKSIKDNTSFFSQQPSDLLSMKKIKQIDFEDYKTTAENNGINWSMTNFVLDQNQFGEMPKVSDFKSDRTFAPTNVQSTKSFGLMKTPDVFVTKNRDDFSDMLSIWHADRGLGLWGGQDAVSENDPMFTGGSLAGLNFKRRDFTGSKLIVPNPEKDIVSYKSIPNLIVDNDKSYDKYSATAKFLADPDRKWTDDEIDFVGENIRRQLSKVYNGESIGEVISGADTIARYFPELKASLGAKKTDSLMVLRSEANKAIDSSIEQFAANPDEQKRRDIIFSGTGLLNKFNGKDLSFVKNRPMNIYSIDKDGIQDKPEQPFPFIVNGNLDDLDAKTRKEIEKTLASKNPGNITSNRLPKELIQFPIPNEIAQALGTPGNAEIEIVYDEWKGKLYDPVAKKFADNPTTTFLPANVDKTLFESLNVDSRRLSKSDNSKYNAADITGALMGVDWRALSPKIKTYADGVLNNKPDAILAKEIIDQIDGTFKSSYIKSKDVTFPGLETLVTPISNSDTSVNLGKHLLERIEAYRASLGSKADTAAGKPVGFAGLNDNEIPAAVRETAKASLSIFGSNKVPGLAQNWLARYIGRLPLATKMKPDFAKRAASYAAGVIENFGGYLGQIGNSVNNPNQYQYLKRLWTLASGASQVFSGLANGDTSLLGQFKGSGLNMISLFTSLGGGTLLRRIMGLELNNDWKNLLANQLTDGKTRTVGTNKLGAKKDMADSVPKSLQDLIDLLFNPYNEFDTTNKRSNLITKFVDDLTNFRQPNGVPYFDKNTMDFITSNVNMLKTWYSGDNNNWLGEDYFFDKNADKDNVQRTTNFLNSLGMNQDIYDNANKAHIALGLGNKFGILPGPGWFTSRAAQGFQTGGMVYAADGGQMVNFQPRGTDTVPAMLTPGEFVVNRQATQANLPLLKAINGGNKAYSKGGSVYAANGGMINMNENGPANPREALLEREKQADRTAAFQEDSALIAGGIGIGAMPDSRRLIPKQQQPINNNYPTLSLTDNNIPKPEVTISGASYGIQNTVRNTVDQLNSRSPMANALDDISMLLAGAGLVPVVGNLADLAAVPIDLMRGDLTGAGLSALAAVPGLGAFANAGKLTAKGAMLLKRADQAAALVNVAYDGAELAKNVQEVYQANKNGTAATASTAGMYIWVLSGTSIHNGREEVFEFESDATNKKDALKAYEEYVAQDPDNRKQYSGVEARKNRLLSKSSSAQSTTIKTPKQPRGRFIRAIKWVAGGAKKLAAIGAGSTLALGLGSSAYRSWQINKNARTQLPNVGTNGVPTIDHTGRETAADILPTIPNNAGVVPPKNMSGIEEENIKTIDKLKATLPAIFDEQTVAALDTSYPNLKDRLGAYRNKAYFKTKDVKYKDFKKHGGMIYASEGVHLRPDGTTDSTYDQRRQKRIAYIEEQITREERSEFGKLGLLYNDTTDKDDIKEALQKRKDYKAKIDYYIQQFTTDKSLDIKLKRYPRISEASQDLISRSIDTSPVVSPFPAIPKPKVKSTSTLNTGGVVYASEGTLVNYQPRGTDTIPAMLTPGEFVVNAKAAQAHLPLLYAINNGSKVGTKGYSTGGIVYLEGGGEAPFDSILSALKRDLNDIKDTTYDPAYEERIKEILADREARGVKRVERTRRNAKTGKYETTTVEEKSDTRRQEEKEARDKKNQEDIDNYNSFEKQRQGYLKEIQENKPKQEQALNLAKEVREKLRVMKVEFIAQIENKVKTEAQRLGVSVNELLEVNKVAQTEWDFIKGKEVEPIGEIFHLLRDIGEITNSNTIFKGGPISMKALSVGNIDTIEGRGPFFSEVGAQELYEKDAHYVRGILPDEFKYVSGKEDKVIGPISLMSGGDRGVGPRRPPQKEGLEPETLSRGGVVYASNGMLIPYEPKGTDTIPAMLTPGEFVVNRAATQANLPLLKAINNGNGPKGFMKGGVAYLMAGDLAEAAERRRTTYQANQAERRANYRDTKIEQGLVNSPNGQLILQIKNEAENSPQLFEAIKADAINEALTSADLINRYNNVWDKLDPQAKQSAAKEQFNIDKKRVDYLTGIYNNSAQAYATLKGNPKASQIKVQNISILDILKGQEVAMVEAKAIHEAWVTLMKGGISVGAAAQEAAGTGKVAGSPPPVGKQNGGIVYAATGGSILPFTPVSRGTDTVPAMLTPGEFVVNKVSTQRNLPLLRTINNNRYANGGAVGKVNYFDAGGQAGAGGVSTGGGSSTPNMDGLSQFTTTFQGFIDQLKQINPVINLKGEHTVNVNFNGAQYLAAMDESIRRIVVSEVNAAMDKLHRDTEGALGGK